MTTLTSGCASEKIQNCSSAPAAAAGILLPLDLFLGDLMRSLEQDEGEKLGGKSAEAARFILRAIDRELDRA